MIKLIDYKDFEQREIYISKSSICRMKRKGNDGLTTANIIGYGECYFSETPEEILAMPDIETSEKVIDWEQRRYEIVKQMLPTVYEIAFEANDYMPPRELIAEDAIKYADALINELKKGGEK